MTAVHDMRTPSLSELRSTLASFASSDSTFRVVHSITSSSKTAVLPRLHVLDSSFNPPTRAHLRIATSALTEDDAGPGPKRLLLLLATQNADKASKPAPFENRLAMMSLFAHDILAEFQSMKHAAPVVDIGVTKEPYFHDKAEAISSSAFYMTSGQQPEQVHLVGFDTLIRILDAKYYPPTKTLTPLTLFFDQHRLRVTYRTDADWGGRAEQDNYIRDLASGSREHEGGKRQWAEKIKLVEGRNSNDEAISSTKVREASKMGDAETLNRLLTKSVAEYVLREGLYGTSASR